MSEFFILKPFERKRLCYGRFQSATRPLEWARGATLAVDVVAASDIPPYDLAMRDGWAVSSLDDHRDIDEVSLLNGTLPEPLKRGRARWINTGGMIPIGCDAVIAAASPDDRAAARQAVASERHVLGVRETALLSEACIEEVQVSRTPRILILATGSEITMGPKNPVACRRASNAVYLQALLDAAGIEQSRIVRLPDDADEIARALERRVGIDLIVSIGGTGRGTHDLTRRAIAATGGTVIEGTGDVKGAPPFVLADLGGTPLVGLPGNPLGLTLPRREVVDATLACDADIDAEGDLCVTLDRNEEGRLVATPVRKGSCRTRLFAVEAGTVSVKPCCLRAGETVPVERFFN